MTDDPICHRICRAYADGRLSGRLRAASPRASSAPSRSAPRSSAPSSSPSRCRGVIMGCVLPAGQGQAPARQASLGAGLPLAAGCTTVNKMCGSGMKAAMLAHDLLARGQHGRGGRRRHGEMTNAPYLHAARRAAATAWATSTVLDHMFYDGLEDAYDKGRLMGSFAEDCADKYAFTREAQDAVRDRLARARAEGQRGRLVRLGDHAGGDQGRQGGATSSRRDEQPFKANFDKIPTLKPAFRKDGTVTAANSSSISDGAAALVMMRRSTRRQARPRAARDGRRPRHARPGAGAGSPRRRSARSESCYATTGWTTRRVDLCEINEAFAVVTMAAMTRAQAAARAASTCTAAPARSATRSAHRARASS